jgi:hypothetical protein
VGDNPEVMRTATVDADPRPRLSHYAFYGLIVAGVVIGAVACAAAGWGYLESPGSKPTGHRIWEGVAEQFVLPICVMVGATFGGLLGLATAIAADFRVRRR